MPGVLGTQGPLRIMLVSLEHRKPFHFKQIAGSPEGMESNMPSERVSDISLQMFHVWRTCLGENRIDMLAYFLWLRIEWICLPIFRG